jgi:hypothetical protein
MVLACHDLIDDLTVAIFLRKVDTLMKRRFYKLRDWRLIRPLNSTLA